MAITPTRAINVARQLIAITAALPDAAGTTRRGVLDCRLRIQPSPASQTYTVRLIYRHGRPPKVTVTDPPLALHPDASQLPHVYPGNELCLYYPRRVEARHAALRHHSALDCRMADPLRTMARDGDLGWWRTYPHGGPVL